MKCETCRFWDQYTENEEVISMGICYRYPPVPVAFVDASGSETRIRQEYPETNNGDSCGEWQEKAS